MRSALFVIGFLGRLVPAGRIGRRNIHQNSVARPATPGFRMAISCWNTFAHNTKLMMWHAANRQHCQLLDSWSPCDLASPVEWFRLRACHRTRGGLRVPSHRPGTASGLSHFRSSQIPCRNIGTCPASSQCAPRLPPYWVLPRIPLLLSFDGLLPVGCSLPSCPVLLLCLFLPVVSSLPLNLVYIFLRPARR